MAAPPLAHRHLFGLKADVKNNVHYLEEGVILYPVGHTVVIHNLDTNVQKFITGSSSSTQGGKPSVITALAVSPNKRYVAIGEKGAEKAVCSIYDVRSLKRKKQLMTDDAQYQCREFVSLAFSPDGKTLLTQGGAPYWVLIHWHWSRAKALQVTSIMVKSNPLYQCSFCPADPTLVCVTGRQVLLYFRIDPAEAKMRPIETTLFEYEPEDYVCHTWSDQKQCIIASKEGGLIYMENAMFRSKLSPPPAAPDAPATTKHISCMASFNTGFVVGCDDGIVLVYERDEKEHFKLKRQYNLDSQGAGKIKTIAISP